MADPVDLTSVEPAIRVIRGHRVMLDSDLADLYGVAVKQLNQQVRRNIDRFPPDFMFSLEADESESLRSQFATLKRSRGQHRKYAPMAFTEQGVAMLSSVLRSPRAVQVNIEIMRAFVRLRRMLDSNAELSKQIEALERKYDGKFRIVFDAIRELSRQRPTAPSASHPAVPQKPVRPIGFRAQSMKKGAFKGLDTRIPRDRDRV
jgi:hypothetical protein